MNKKSGGIIASVAVSVFLVILFTQLWTKNLPPPFPQDISVAKVLILGKKTIQLEVATTSVAQMLGLSYRKSLPDDQGLLFVLPVPTKQGIWMKDMNFSIDIVWLDSTFKVVDVARAVAPETFPKIFTPKTDASYVLEIPAGTFEKSDVEIGDRVMILENK